MRRFHRLLIVLLSLACGCNQQRAIRNVTDALIAQPDPTVELLESELRWMEDNLYHLDAQLESSQRQLESTRRENAALRLELAEQSQSPAGPTSKASGAPTKADSKERSQTQGYDEESLTEDDLLDFSPKIEFGSPAQESSDKPASDKPSEGLGGMGGILERDAEASPAAPAGNPLDPPAEADQPPLLLPETLKLPEGSVPEEAEPQEQLPQPAADDPPLIEPFENPFLDDLETDQVLRIELNEKLTGGFDSDRIVGHDGVMVVIEPVDAWAKYVPAAGAVTVTLREPGQASVQGLIGKWKFSAEEIAGKMKQSMLAKGIHLELPWPHGAPTVDRLDLLVEYESRSGKRLRASREIRIVPSTQSLSSRASMATARSWYADRAQKRK